MLDQWQIIQINWPYSMQQVWDCKTNKSYSWSVRVLPQHWSVFHCKMIQVQNPFSSTESQHSQEFHPIEVQESMIRQFFYDNSHCICMLISPRPLPLHFEKNRPPRCNTLPAKGCGHQSSWRREKPCAARAPATQRSGLTWMMDGLKTWWYKHSMAEIAPGNQYHKQCQNICQIQYNLWHRGATASFWNKKLPSRATGHLRLLGSLGNPSKRPAKHYWHPSEIGMKL